MEVKDKIITTIEQFEGNLNNIITAREVFKQVEVSKRLQAELVGRLYIEEEIITSTQVNIIKDQLSFSENFKGNSAWDIYNHCTEALKTAAPTSYIEDHIKLHEFMFEEFIN